MLTDQRNQEIFHYIIRVSKKDAAFTYFLLESHEGMCFYSTIKESIGQSYRDIELKGSIEYQKDVLRLLNNLKEEFPVVLLLDQKITINS